MWVLRTSRLFPGGLELRNEIDELVHNLLPAPDHGNSDPDPRTHTLQGPVQERKPHRAQH